MEAKMLRSVFAIVLIAVSLWYSCALADQETEARKLYLEASSLDREGKYEEAKAILEKILKEYAGSEISIQADEKLSQVLAKIEESKLPQIPGIYVKKTSGELYQLAAGEPISKSKGLDKYWKDLGGKSIVDYMRALEQAPEYSYILWLANYPEIPSEDIESFIIFMPDVNDISMCKFCYVLPAVGKYELAWTADEPEYSKGKTKYIIYEDWNLQAKESNFKSSELVKKTIKDGMFEIKSQRVLNFGTPIQFAVTVGNRAFPLIIQPSFAEMIMSRYYEKGTKATEGINLLKEKLQQRENDIPLNKALAELYLLNDNPTEALQLSERLIELSKSSGSENKPAIDDLYNRAQFKKVIFDVKENYTVPGANYAEGLNQIQKAIDIRPQSSEALFLKTQLLYLNGQLDEACLEADKTVKAASQENSPEKKSCERYRDDLLCEKFTIEATKNHLETGQDLETGIDLAKKAVDKNEDSYKALCVLAQLYYKTGKIKDARKNAEKALKKAKENNAPDMTFYEQLVTKYKEEESKK